MSIWYVFCSSLIGGGIFLAVLGLLCPRSVRRLMLFVAIGTMAAYGGWLGHPDQRLSGLPWAGYLYQELGQVLPDCPTTAADAPRVFNGDARHRETWHFLNTCREEAVSTTAENAVAADMVVRPTRQDGTSLRL